MALLWLCAAPWMWAAPPIDFQKTIRPILSDACFQCHGPDASTRMAGLRLDIKSAAFEAGKRGAAIVPGKPEQSLLYQRIIEERPARRMPPASAHKTLTAEQIDLLKQWIAQGAPWQEHWAYAAPVPPKLPAVKDAAWVRTRIDRFVLAELEARGLSPAPEADRRTLIRRVALDLTGLPPHPTDAEIFARDRDPKAYEKMVDRYLASPAYGEHRGRYWLDAARYADTHGIHVDNYREMWPYRDWVIAAFNRNLPFDQFTIEQLAGDMLPNPTLDQRIATGFHRCNVTTNEAGIIEDEYAEIYAKDRAETTAAVWMGLTVGCAACHDHKFDPIPQKDFYALGAFFRNTTQKVMDDNIPDTPPIVLVPRMEDRDRWQEVSRRLTEIRDELPRVREQAVPAFGQWRTGFRSPQAPKPLEAGAELYAAETAGLAAAAPSLARLDASNVANRQGLFLTSDEGVAVESAPALDADKPFSLAVSFYFPKAEQRYSIARHRDSKDKGRGWELSVGARVVQFDLVGDDGKGIQIRAGHLEQIQHGTWNHVVITYDGSRHQSGLALYQQGRAIPTQGRGNINLDLQGTIAVDKPLLLGASLKEGAIADFRIFGRMLTEGEAYLLSQWPAIEAALPNPATAGREAMLTYFVFNDHEPYRRLTRELAQLNIEARSIARRGAITHVMHERDDASPHAWILHRGAYDQRRDKVDAATPTILPPIPPDLPRNRMGLAQWLFRPENPLTARVTVNRMWQEIFGTGLVRTPDDFGSQGEPPVNQALLDWLAVDFRENGWDVKHFYRQILLSAAYRQSAALTPEKLARDPDNRYLSRGPRFRMDAEMIRDYALAASGLLLPEIGGPSVRPYQPEGVWEAVAMVGSNTRNYKRDDGKNCTAGVSIPSGSAVHHRRRSTSSTLRPGRRARSAASARTRLFKRWSP
ncbi:MAG: DUF1549 domain-containing protein [Bryobacterales bacterium]|nr:DUF1549 domain-containing protein [Bryobacterales bacterium]